MSGHGGASVDAPGWPAEFVERYRAEGYWTGETFPQMLRERARRHPDRVAVVDPAANAGAGRRWTYGELQRDAEAVARALVARGIGAGDRVVVQLPNVGEFFTVVFGLFRLGALPVFALPAHRDSEMRYFCEFAEARAVVVPERHAGFDHARLAHDLRGSCPSVEHVIVVTDTASEQLPAGCERLADLVAEATQDDAATSLPPEPAAADLAFLQLSGGSTGVPKLIPRTHDDYLYSIRGSNEICGLDEDGVYLCALPAAHNFPLSSPGTLGALHAGARIVMCPAPAPEVAFPLIAAEGVTMTGLVPPLALAWMEAATVRDDDLGSLRTLLVGGAKLSEQAARRIGPTLGCRLQQVFGMAEGLVNYTRLDDDEDVVVTTQGRPISPADEVLVVDDDDEPVPPGVAGHLLTRGPYTIRGYWRAPEHDARAFTSDGFYRTGDIVRRLPSGHLVVEGRAKDQINRGGEKIAAEEVENHLLAHPSVFDASVVGEPDDYLGERSCAYVILRELEAAPSGVELKRFVRSRGLASFKVPDRIEFVTEFPQTGVGKVSKKHLRLPGAS